MADTPPRPLPPIRGRIGTCGRRMTALTDDSMLHLRALGWPVPAVLYATGTAALRTFALARAGEVAQAIRERRYRHALRREAGRWAPEDPLPDVAWRALLASIDDRTALALVTVADARKRRDPEVIAWLASWRVDHPRGRKARTPRGPR